MSVDDCVIRGPTFPGLWLGVDELLRHGEVMAVLQQGLASSERKDFVERLSEVKQ